MIRDRHQARYRILGTDLDLSSDSEQLLELFDRDYGSFRTTVSGVAADLRIRACFNGPEGPGVSFSRADATADGADRHGEQSLDGHPTPVHHAWQWVTQTLFDSLNHHLLLHAAVAVRHGRAVILAGSPGTGKTTMALALAEAGFTLYSDEICPVHRRTGRVHPFPRSLWVVPEEGPGEPVSDGLALRGGKVPLPTVTRATETTGGGTAAPALLLILDPGPKARAMGRLVIGAREPGWEPLLDALVRLHPGIEVTRPLTDVAEFRLDYPLEQGLAVRLADLLEEHRDHLLNVFRGETARPDFSRSPALETIPAHQAAFGLLPGLKQRIDSSGRGRDAGSAMRMKELIEHIGDTSCFRLTVGRLEEQEPLVRQLALDATRPKKDEYPT